MPETGALSFSITGEIITNIAREHLYYSNDLGKALDLLMSCMVNDKLKEYERMALALQILDGKAELRGTYPGDDYGFVELDERNPRYSISNHIIKLNDKIQAQQAELQELYAKMAIMADNMDSYDKRNANAEWQLEGYEGKIFPEEGVAPDPRFFEDDEADINPMLQSYLDRMQDERDDDYGWLEPNGTFHPVDFANHEQWAYETIKERGWWDEYDRSDTSGIYAHGDFLVQKKGWVLLHNPGMGVAIVTKSDTKSLSKAQKEFLFDYYTERNKPKEAASYLED